MSHTKAQEMHTTLSEDLVEILMEAESICDTKTCKGCKHDGDILCRVKAMADYLTEYKPKSIYYIPCKIGDTVWGLRRRNGIPIPIKGRVSEIFFVGSEMSLCITVAGVVRGSWGVNVFATEDEAKNAVEDLINNEQET